MSTANATGIERHAARRGVRHRALSRCARALFDFAIHPSRHHVSAARVDVLEHQEINVQQLNVGCEPVDQSPPVERLAAPKDQV